MQKRVQLHRTTVQVHSGIVRTRPVTKAGQSSAPKRRGDTNLALHASKGSTVKMLTTTGCGFQTTKKGAQRGPLVTTVTTLSRPEFEVMVTRKSLMTPPLLRETYVILSPCHHDIFQISIIYLERKSVVTRLQNRLNPNSHTDFCVTTMVVTKW